MRTQEQPGAGEVAQREDHLMPVRPQRQRQRHGLGEVAVPAAKFPGDHDPAHAVTFGSTATIARITSATG